MSEIKITDDDKFKKRPSRSSKELELVFYEGKVVGRREVTTKFYKVKE